MRRSENSRAPLALGVEIGGTKIQVGVGTTDGKLLPEGLLRRQVIRERGAEGIRREIVSMVEDLLESSRLSLSEISRVGIGFGGIVDTTTGIVLKSYQIDGWDYFPLKTWAEKQWAKPVFIQNDASTAGLAESLRGAGKGCSRVFYMTIGSGIGGGWILNGKIDNGQGYGSAEIGHTWVTDPNSGELVELEQVCSGWSIGQRARLAAFKHKSIMANLAGGIDLIDSSTVYLAATKDDPVANRILLETYQTLGLAISNVISLFHPEKVILGGGVSLMGPLFWKPLKREIKSRTIPLFASQVDITKAKLKEDVVVVGALCLN